MKTTPQSRSALRALEAKATPGPWELRPDERFLVRRRGYNAIVIERNVLENGELERAYPAELSDSEFIVAARNALPDLLDDLDESDTALADRDRRIAELETALREAKHHLVSRAIGDGLSESMAASSAVALIDRALDTPPTKDEEGTNNE